MYNKECDQMYVCVHTQMCKQTISGKKKNIFGIGMDFYDTIWLIKFYLFSFSNQYKT